MHAADGIIRIIDVKMEEAIKAISTMRGYDLRDFMLLAFGGAGPVHAGRDGRASSAWPACWCRSIPASIRRSGLLMADVKHDYVRRA